MDSIDGRYQAVVEAVDKLAARFTNMKIRPIDPATKSVPLPSDVTYAAKQYQDDRAKRDAISGGSSDRSDTTSATATGSDSATFLDSGATGGTPSGAGGGESSTLLGSSTTTTTTTSPPAVVMFIESGSSGASSGLADDRSFLSSSSGSQAATATTTSSSSHGDGFEEPSDIAKKWPRIRLDVTIDKDAMNYPEYKASIEKYLDLVERDWNFWIDKRAHTLDSEGARKTIDRYKKKLQVLTDEIRNYYEDPDGNDDIRNGFLARASRLRERIDNFEHDHNENATGASTSTATTTNTTTTTGSDSGGVTFIESITTPDAGIADVPPITAPSPSDDRDAGPRMSEDPTIMYGGDDDDEQALDEVVPVVDESAPNTTSLSQWSSDLLRSSTSSLSPSSPSSSSSSSSSSSYSPPEETQPSGPEAAPTGLADLVPDADCSAIPPMQIDDPLHASVDEYNALLRKINSKEAARADSIDRLKTMLRRLDLHQRTKSIVVDGGDGGPTRLAMEHYIERSSVLRHEHMRAYKRMLDHPGQIDSIRELYEQMFLDYDSLIENVLKITGDLGERYFNEPRKTPAPVAKKRGATLGITPVLEKRFVGRPVEFLPDRKRPFAFGAGPRSLWNAKYETDWIERHDSLWKNVSFKKSPLVVRALDDRFRDQLREVSEDIPNITNRGLARVVQERLLLPGDAHREDVFAVLIEYHTSGGLQSATVTQREAHVAALFWIPQKISVGGVEKKIKLAFRGTGESQDMSYRAYDVIVRISKNQHAQLFDTIPVVGKVAFHLFACDTSPVSAVPEKALVPEYTAPALSPYGRYSLHPSWVDQYRWIHALVADSYLYNTRRKDV